MEQAEDDPEFRRRVFKFLWVQGDGGMASSAVWQPDSGGPVYLDILLFGEGGRAPWG